MTRSKSKSPLQLETVIEEGDGGSRELNFEVVNTQGFAADDSMGDMPPLKRVQSRDGGYCSVGVPEKGRSQSV